MPYRGVAVGELRPGVTIDSTGIATGRRDSRGAAEGTAHGPDGPPGPTPEERCLYEQSRRPGADAG
ncbi:hypothetical protein Srufu_001200 [Streptomyces libani subsp. rufus]|nr:hypothetical protein Srufu_001200 [Streptomyces libani subsp. rufus]